MDVYLVPVGRDQYELYCESPPETAALPEGEARGFWQRAVARFRTVLSAVEHEERRRHQEPQVPAEETPGVGARLKRGVLRWMAERIAEQRLLWRLRNVDHATAMFPDDLDAARTRDRIVKMLERDRDRHLVWLVVNTILFVGSGLLMPVPGPNVVAYYFAFRLVGHFLSWRGAGRAVASIEWTYQPSDALTALRQAETLEDGAREQHVQAVAARLGLHGLARFYLRIAVSTA